MSDETWIYLHKNPELIDEILNDSGRKFPLVTLTEHLIELVVFGAKVDFAPMDSELDKRAIENNYGSRARQNLVSLMQKNAISLFLVTGYVIENWRKDAEIEIQAVMSLFKLLSPQNSLPTTANCLIAIADEMAKTDYLPYDLIEILVYCCNAENQRDKIVEYLIKLLDHRHYRKWVLEALVETKNPDNGLVEKVVRMSNLKTYDEKKQLNDMPEHEKKMSPILLDQIGSRNSSGYISKKDLLELIRESNLKTQALAINLLNAWNIKQG